MYARSRLTQKDFADATLATLFQRPLFRVISILVSLSFLVGGISQLFTHHTFSIQPFTPLFFLLAFYGILYFSAIRNYRYNKRFQETIEYKFDDAGVSIVGESFNSRYSWEKVYKVTKTKRWIFIWQSNQLSTPILRKDILEDNIPELKKIIDQHRVKNNL